MKWPFSLTLSNFLLRGKNREIARIEYDYSGYERDLRIATLEYAHDKVRFEKELLDIKLRYGVMSQYEHDVAMCNLLYNMDDSGKKALLDIELSHGRLSQSEYKVKFLEIFYTGTELEKKILAHRHEIQEISSYQYAVDLATIDHSGDDLNLRLIEIEYEFGRITENDKNKKIATIKREPYFNLLKFEYNYKKGGAVIECDWNDFHVDELRQHGYLGNDDQQIINDWLRQVGQSLAGEGNLE